MELSRPQVPARSCRVTVDPSSPQTLAGQGPTQSQDLSSLLPWEGCDQDRLHSGSSRPVRVVCGTPAPLLQQVWSPPHQEPVMGSRDKSRAQGQGRPTGTRQVTEMTGTDQRTRVSCQHFKTAEPGVKPRHNVHTNPHPAPR